MSKKRTRTYLHRDVTICLDAGLSLERDELLGKRGPQAKKQLLELEERMRDSLLTIRVVGVPRPEYVAIQRAHPPKSALEAFNPDTFFTDFVYKTASEVEADGSLSKLSEWPRRDWDEIADGLTQGEFYALAKAIEETNVGRVDTRPLLRGSVSTEPSSPNSEQPASGE